MLTVGGSVRRSGVVWCARGLRGCVRSENWCQRMSACQIKRVCGDVGMVKSDQMLTVGGSGVV